MAWKNYAKAFPDKYCECLKQDPLPTYCGICGADRSAANWIPDSEPIPTNTD